MISSLCWYYILDEHLGSYLPCYKCDLFVMCVMHAYITVIACVNSSWFLFVLRILLHHWALNHVNSHPRHYSLATYDRARIESANRIIFADIIESAVQYGGTRWRCWLRHCSTSRKVAVSIPDGSSRYFIYLILPAALWPCGRHSL